MLRSGIVTAKGTPFGTPAPSFTTNASTGRAMFFRSRAPSSSNARPSRPHMIAHRSRNANTTGRAFSLNSCGNVHRVPVQIGSVCNRITDVDGDAEADSAIRWLIAVVDREPAPAPSRHSAPPRRCCRTRSAANRPRSERSGHRAPRWRDLLPLPECPQSLEGSGVIQSDQAAVATMSAYITAISLRRSGEFAAGFDDIGALPTAFQVRLAFMLVIKRQEPRRTATDIPQESVTREQPWPDVMLTAHTRRTHRALPDAAASHL